MKCLEHCLAHSKPSVGYTHTCVRAYNTYINLLLKVKESKFIKNIPTKKEGGKRGPSPPPLLLVLQNRPTSLDPADWLIPCRDGPCGDSHCSAEAGGGTLVLGALQEVKCHVAHVVHLIHLILGTHAPVELILAEVCFLCKGKAGPRGVIPTFPHTHTETGVRSLQSSLLPFRDLSKVFIGHLCPPPAPPQRCWRAQTSLSKALTQSLAHSRYSEQFIQQIPFIHPTIFIMPSTVRGTGDTAEEKCRHDLSSFGAYTLVG